MNILFLTMSRITSLQNRGIYPDLLRQFIKEGHYVAIASPAERYLKEDTNYRELEGYSVLRIKVGNLQKTNVIEKGISTVLLELQFLAAIKKYYSGIKFDLVIYSTPPITFGKVVDYIRNRDNARSYLLLKDIFPQNAVDLGMFSKKSVFYKYFRRKEKKLYKQSDYIGCMSQANVDYVIKNNLYINKDIVHIAPNSIECSENDINVDIKADFKKKHNIPENATVFVYGGNLGKPQNIPFVIECLKNNAGKKDRYFIICGTGTEYKKLEAYISEEHPSNVMLINGLPKEEYEIFVRSCDVGLIFLDHRFTIPNFPSRILSYMQNSMPVLACTDVNTDVGQVITSGDFGWWCESDDVEKFTQTVDEACNSDLKMKGENSRNYIMQYYSVDVCYDIILSRLTGEKRFKDESINIDYCYGSI